MTANLSAQRDLTDAELYALYINMGCDYDSDTRAAVIAEMRTVLAARTLSEAGEAIEWWGGWGLWQATETPRAWAREYRRRAAALLAEEAADAERAAMDAGGGVGVRR